MCRPGEAEGPNAASLLPLTSEPGIFVRSGRFQDVVDALQRAFFALRVDPDEVRYRSSGFLPRRDLARSSYLDKFPQFVARVSSELAVDNHESLVTLPSACLSLYPIISESGLIAKEGLLAKVAAPCFRNENGYSPERMRAFHMAEYVHFGEASQTQMFREDMLRHVQAWLADLDLPARVVRANDPFFGRMGEILAERQRASNLKLEVLVKIADGKEVAAFSVNDHRDFFCTRWNIELASGARAESSCVGVGLERLALSMFNAYGQAISTWPVAIKSLVQS